MPSSRRSSRPRDWTWVSLIAGRIFTVWATKEALEYMNLWKLDTQGNLRSFTGFLPSVSVCVCVCVCVCMYVCVCACSVVPNSVWPHGLWPTRLLCPWDLPGKNIGSELSFPSPADLPDPGIQSLSLTSPALAVGFFTLRLALNSYSRKYLVYSVAQN